MKPNYFYWGGTSVQLPCALPQLPCQWIPKTFLDLDALRFCLIFGQIGLGLVHRFVRQPKTAARQLVVPAR